MRLPDCHSRRAPVPGTDVFFCAHPQLHVSDHRVTPSICKSCDLARQPPPEKMRAYPDGTHRRRPQIQLVVAKYRENVDWLQRFECLDTLVYDKSDPGAAHPLPNVGREAHTYLHHILKHYDDLAELTVFLQGDPSDHVPDLDEKIWSLTDDVLYRDLCDFVLVEDGEGNPVQPGLPLAKMFRCLFDETPPNHFTCHAAACFAVSRETIRARPRSFYERALQLVLELPQGPWVIERLWERIFRTRPRTSGIVTASDAGFFRELQWLIRSVSPLDRYPLCVIDLGLEAEQREWCAQQRGVTLIPPPMLYEPLERMRSIHWWQAWLKPFYIVHAPYDRVLWIDADCVVQGDLAEAFSLIDEGPLLIRDGTEAVTENNAELYRFLPLPEGTKTVGVSVNAGVVGLCKLRDRILLDTWAHGVLWAAMNADRRRHVAWVDQGILLWAALDTGCARFIREELDWNHPARENADLVRSLVVNRRSLLEEIRARYPAAKIVHWLGVYKLSRQLEAELQRLFIEGFADVHRV